MTFIAMKASAPALLILLLALAVPGLQAASLPQQPDTTITGENIYQDGPDSLETGKSFDGKAMINDAGQAEKIVTESDPTGILDSLSKVPYFKDSYLYADPSMKGEYAFPSSSVPVFPDSIYAKRIELLGRETTIDLVYNQTVKGYIELYAMRKRALTSKVLGLKEIYFPLIEEYLDKYDLPLELKYLAVVESALNPTAGSRAGAKGLWQFMYYTGKLYGLKVSSIVDERFDPYKATDAACRHLKDLYGMFGDWSLVMAAYNSGAGNVKKAIRRAGGVSDYWAIWPFLPRETRGYVPAFIAVTYVMNYAPEHNLYPLHPGILYDGIDTVMVKQPLAFDQLSEFLNVPPEDLRFLNPMFKSGIIPAYDGKIYSLRLPKEYIDKFVSDEAAIYNYKSKSGLEKDKLLAEIKKVSDRSVHIVKSGESLGLIARKYHVTVNQLKSWNNLRSNMIHPGQRLTLYASAQYAGSPSGQATYSKAANANPQPAAEIAAANVSGKPLPDSITSEQRTEPLYHFVKSGENLAMIAGKYGCSVEQLRGWNALKNNTIYAKQKLIVGNAPVKPATSAPALDSSQADSKFVYYTVKKGDTLWEISQKYKGVTVDEIKRLNKLGSSSRLQVGQKLKISLEG